MSRASQSPTLASCCTALAGTVAGTIRPRPVDRRFLGSLVDAGLPPARTRVTVSALRQNPRTVPALLAEGVFAPRTLEIAMTTLVVDHPRARFLVDPAVCRNPVARVINQQPVWLRPAFRPNDDIVATVDALAELAADSRPVDFALATHAHWDHVSGLLDLPGMPLTLHRIEHRWATDPVTTPVGAAAALADRPMQTYDLDGPPVSTFTASHDLFGDGSVLLVDLSGHTPGSVGVLLATEDGPILLAGDVAWHSIQVERIRQRSAFPGVFVDDDRDAAFLALHRLHAASAALRVIPAHDHHLTQALGSTGDLAV